MTITHFDSAQNLIAVTGHVWGPRGHKELNLVVDTAASETLIVPHVLDELGYSARLAERRTVITSPLGREPGYLIRVSRFSCLGFDVPDFLVHAHDLADDDSDLDGLLGLTFLRRFNIEFRFGDGLIKAEPLADI